MAGTRVLTYACLAPKPTLLTPQGHPFPNLAPTLQNTFIWVEKSKEAREAAGELSGGSKPQTFPKSEACRGQEGSSPLPCSPPASHCRLGVLLLVSALCRPQFPHVYNNPDSLSFCTSVTSNPGSHQGPRIDWRQEASPAPQTRPGPGEGLTHSYLTLPRLPWGPEMGRGARQACWVRAGLEGGLGRVWQGGCAWQAQVRSLERGHACQPPQLCQTGPGSFRLRPRLWAPLWDPHPS